MELHCTKMHGLGNDFVVIDAINQPITFTPAQVRMIADRHVGVGCDQLLLVEHSHSRDVDFRYRIFNADGSEVQQCGNGARCFARFVRDKALSDKDEIVVETASGVITLYIEADEMVRVNMGVPDFTPASLPFSVPSESLRYELELAAGTQAVGAVSMGNPHVVVEVDDIEHTPVESLGLQLESHSLFPERVNVGFMQILSREQLRLRVYERGAGETLACGTGACAAMAVGHRWGLLADEVTVSLPGGDLMIRWSGGDQPLWMTGPAITVFEGTITL